MKIYDIVYTYKVAICIIKYNKTTLNFEALTWLQHPIVNYSDNTKQLTMLK